MPPGSLINVNQNCAPGVCPVPPRQPEPKHHHSLNPLDWFGHHKRELPTIRTVVREQVIGTDGPSLGDAGTVVVPAQTPSGNATPGAGGPIPSDPRPPTP